MKELTVNKITEVCNGELITQAKDYVIEEFNRDTRTIKKGEMYIAIKGESFDGNNYIEEALKKGAIGCIVDCEKVEENIIKKYNDKAIIKVDDTIKAIQQLAKYKRMQYNIPVVAVTGSVGKTSTKDLIASVLSEKYNVLKTEGNLNNHIGLPLTLLKLKEHTAIVIEMGMNHFGEISTLTDIAKPNICTITNVGTAHIGNLGSRENILKAKLEILEGLQDDGSIVINVDNDLLNKWNISDKKYEKITYGIENSADYLPKNIQLNKDGSEYILEADGCNYIVQIPVGGMHFIYNSLCAIAIARKLGIEMNDIIKGIKKVSLTKRRMEVTKTSNEIYIINDSYNASYDSMKAILEYLKSIAGKNRKIAVLGDMLELGDFSKQLHEKVGEEILKNNIDILITVGKEIKYTANIAEKQGIKQVYSYDNNQDAIKKINEIKEKDDYIILKASNGMKFNEIYENII